MLTEKYSEKVSRILLPVDGINPFPIIEVTDPVIVDPGVEIYSGKTFSQER